MLASSPVRGANLNLIKNYMPRDQKPDVGDRVTMELFILKQVNRIRTTIGRDIDKKIQQAMAQIKKDQEGNHV